MSQNLLQRIEIDEKRVEALHDHQILQKIRQDLHRRGVWHYKFYRVPKDYYALTLEERAKLLQGSVPQLCKSIIFENTVCDHHEVSDITNSRYYLVIVQYMSKINTTTLRNFVHSLRLPTERLSKSSFNFQLANEEISFKFSGFEHNAITPFGMNVTLPVIIDSRILEVQPKMIFLGGGFVDMKLLVPVNDLVNAFPTKIGLITENR